MLHNQIRTACPCPCCMFMTMLHSMSMPHVNINVHWHIYRNGMPDCPASSQSGTGLKKLTMPKPVRYRNKLTQSGIFLVRYRTQIRDAGMPTPALVSSMPMPSYADFWLLNKPQPYLSAFGGDSLAVLQVYSALSTQLLAIKKTWSHDLIFNDTSLYTESHDTALYTTKRIAKNLFRRGLLDISTCR